MQAHLLTFFLLLAADPAFAPIPSGEPSAIPAIVEGAVCPCQWQTPWPGVAARRPSRYYPPPTSEYFYRPFDYRHQFDYPWHPRVRPAPRCCGSIPERFSGPMLLPFSDPDLSRAPSESGPLSADGQP
jgi:hypothetical protein